MTRSRSCSWCHTINVIPEAGIPLCATCHHRADLPRMECDCPMCFKYVVDAAPPFDVVQALPELPRPPYSLELWVGNNQVSIDVSDEAAVVSVIVPDDVDTHAVATVPRTELLPMCDAMMRLMTPIERETLLTAMMLML